MKRVFFISLIGLFQIFCHTMYGQRSSHQQYGIYMQYQNGYSQYANSGVASNIIKVNNNTDKTRQFIIVTHPPKDWSVLGNNQRQVTISAGDSAFIPVRVVSQNNIKGGEIYKIQSSLYSENVVVSSVQWIIESEVKHNWKAKILTDDTYFLYNSDSSSVQVNFNNQGNVDEEISVEYCPSRLLNISKKNNRESFTLKVAHDTTIIIDVSINKEIRNANEIYNKPKRSVEKYSLKIIAKAIGHNNKGWQRSTTFSKTKTTYKDNEKRWNELPLTIDFQTYDILGDNPYASLGLYGTKRFDNQRYLTYNFQFNGALGDYSYLESNYQHVGYYAPKLQVQLGDISNSQAIGIPIQGKGVNVKKWLGKHHCVSGIYTLKSLNSSQNQATNMGLSYAYNAFNNRLVAEVYAQKQNNNNQQNDKELVGGKLYIEPLKNQRFSIRGDMSQMTFNSSGNEAVSGYNVMAGYDGVFFKNITTGVNYQLTSENFVNYAGTENFKTYLNLKISKNHNFLTHYISRSYSPNVWSGDSLVYSGLRSEKQEIKASYRYRKDKQLYSLYGQGDYFLTPDYNLERFGGGLDFIKTLSLYSCINASLSIWNNKFNLIDDDYTSLQFRLTVRQRNFRITGIYYYGARYLTDHINYSESLEVPRSYFVNANYEYWLGRDKNALLDIVGNFNYRTNYDRMQFNLRPKVEYYVSESFKLKGYASLIIYNQGEREYSINNTTVVNDAYTNGRFEMGIGFVKDIGIPLSGRRNYDVKFIAFCDDNGNGIKDNNEESIPNMLIVATKLNENENINFSEYSGNLEVLTNENGEAVLLNVAKGHYRVESHPLQKLKNWYSGRNFSIGVFGNKTIYLPQAKGGKVYGSIQLEKGSYSRFDQEISLANIKISAIDSAGIVYSCLTNKNGSYILNAPMGKYTLSVNEKVFSGAFELANNDFKVVIDKIFSEQQCNFFVKEKERKVVVKKFSSSNSVDNKEKETESKENNKNSKSTDKSNNN